MSKTKQDLFQEGFDEFAGDLLMPAGVLDRESGKIIIFEELIETLTIFEVKAVGQKWGRLYAEAVGLPEVPHVT
jgi:hypothetical protein